MRDEQGRLLKVYHGSPVENLTTFDINFLGTNTGSTDVRGFFFADSREGAESYLRQDYEVKPKYKAEYERLLQIYDKLKGKYQNPQFKGTHGSERRP